MDVTKWLVGLVLCCTAGCNPAQRGPQKAQKVNLAGQTLRVYNFANYLSKSAVSSFEERTGSKVVVETYRSYEEMLRALDGGAVYDVIFPGSYVVERLIKQGRLREMDRNLMPNLMQVPELFRNPPVDPSLRHCAPYTWSLAGLGLLSPRDAPGRDPDSLAALFSERGPKLLMLDDMRATIGMALRYLGLSASTQKAEDLERVRALLGKQAPRVLRWAVDAGPALRSGEATLALAWSGDVLEVAARSPEVRFVVPREGTLLSMDYACVPASARSPELAFAFINHLLDPQIAAELTNALMFGTPNAGGRRLLRAEARGLWSTLESVKDQGRFELMRDVGPAIAQYEAVWRSVRGDAP
jgi:spermidine/putrescine transport system substrate-binding protein